MLGSSIFRDISRVKNVKPFKMGARARPETSVSICHQRPPPRRGESLKSRKSNIATLCVCVCVCVLLTVHLSLILNNDQLDTHLIYFTIRLL